MRLQAFNTKEQCIICKDQTGSCQRVTHGQPMGLLMEKWFSCVMILFYDHSPFRPESSKDSYKSSS